MKSYSHSHMLQQANKWLEESGATTNPDRDEKTQLGLLDCGAVALISNPVI